MTRTKLRLQTNLDACRFIADGIRMAESEGINHIGLSNDFEKLKKVATKLKGGVSEHFDTAYMDLLSERAFWMHCRDDDGKIIAVQAMRKDELGATTLEEFLKANLARLNGGIIKSAAPGPRRITGTVVYHGEMVLTKRVRARQIGPLLARIAQAIALIEWKPNAVYGLTNRHLVLNGFRDRKGYVHGAPHVVEWKELPPNYSPSYSLLWNELEDLEHMMRLGHEVYVADTEKQQK